MSKYTAAAFHQADGTGKSGNPASPAFVDDLPLAHWNFPGISQSIFFWKAQALEKLGIIGERGGFRVRWALNSGSKVVNTKR